MKELEPIFDGDSGPIFRFNLKDGAVATQLAATEVYVYDMDGNFLKRCVGMPVNPKSSGQVDLSLLGFVTDWGGSGLDHLVIRPKGYGAISPAGAAATNLLANPSFDAATGANPARLPDSWTLVGVRTATWDNYANDPWPPAIFGTFQLCNHPTLVDPDYLQQQPVVAVAAGDRLSVGCWHRLHGNVSDASGSAKNNNHGLFFRHGAQANTIVQFEIGTKDWYFATGSVVSPTVEAGVTFGIDGRGTTSSNRYDDAFAFIGDWRPITIEPLRIPVSPRRRVPKTGGNAIAGLGGFEVDSDGDGLGDGWSKANASGVTFSLEKSTTHIQAGDASQKIVLAGFSNKFIETKVRGRFLIGETWRASIWLKTNGALGTPGGAGGWALNLTTDYFNDEAFLISAFSNFGTNHAAFTLYTVDLALTFNSTALIVRVSLNGVSGDVWFDSSALTRL